MGVGINQRERLEDVIRVLAVTGEQEFTEGSRGLLAALDRAQVQTDEVTTVAGCLRRLDEQPYDVLLLEFDRPDTWQEDTRRLLTQRAPHLPIVMISPLDHKELTISILDADLEDRVVTGQAAPELLVSAIRGAVERNRLAASLKYDEQRWRNLIDALTDFLYTVHLAKGRPVRTEFGPRCMAVTGYSAEELAADPELWGSIIPDKDRQRVEAVIARVLQGQTAPPVDHRLRHRDGTWRWVRNTLVPRANNPAGYQSYDGFIVDLTGYNRPGAGPRETEDLYQSLVDCLPECILRKDLEGRFTFVNNRFAQTLNRPQNELVGLTDFDIYRRSWLQSIVRTTSA
jgi:sigma-B regulation protein RsbU (phosphoserine phosphatase)